MHVISRDAPCYYLTSVTRHRLPIFQTDRVKLITCAALNEARQSANIAFYAYAIMPDRLHIITDSTLSPDKTLQFINGITGHRIIEYLKENKYTSSLQKLQHSRGPRRHSHSLWDHHPDAPFAIYGEHADAAGELHAPKSCASGIGNYLVPIPMVECAMLGW